MRLNQFLAQHTDLSRRSADKAIEAGRVEINGVQAHLGDIVIETDTVTLDSQEIEQVRGTVTIKLNKPAGYVCSRAGQGSKTVYDLLPPKYHNLKSVGRLDKDSTGLLLMTNDGNLANLLSHPRYGKTKIYEVTLDKSLSHSDEHTITTKGVKLEDGVSRFQLEPLNGGRHWQVIMGEGRNRQIRRTFAALGYRTVDLHRTHFGKYSLAHLEPGRFSVIMS